MGAQHSESAEIGHRARMIRRRRGLSLDTAAGLAGISKGYLSMLENGRRRFDRRGLLDDLAAALGCAVADLTGQPYLPPDRGSAEALATLPSIALAIYDCTLDDVPDLPARPVDQLAPAAEQANVHRDEARYSLAGRGLGAVLTELQVAAVTGNCDTRRAGLAALALACVAGAATARHLGRAELAVQTARRGHDAARRLEDPTLMGFTAMQRTLALARMGALHGASAVLDEALAALEPIANPTATDTGPAQAAGMLHLTAALGSARGRRARDAEDHLARAGELAARTGECNRLHFHFGPTNVAAWGVNIAVELERGPAAAERINAEPARRMAMLGSAERRAALHLDLARAWSQAEGKRDAEALRHLDAADRIAPQRVRNDPLARELVAALDRRARRRVWELDSLRNRFSIGAGSRPVNT